MKPIKPRLSNWYSRLIITCIASTIGVCFASSPIMPTNNDNTKLSLQNNSYIQNSNNSVINNNRPITNSINNDMAVGTLPGKLNVSPTGAATYDIPISVPPGTADITPKLSIQYNSQQHNGLLGMGFSLQGLTTITRAPQNKAQNGNIHGIDFTDADRFALNGQQLVAVKGEYGQPNTEYRTYNDSYAQVISNGRSGNGPASFTIYTKGGQIAEYAATDDSRLKANAVKPDGTIIDNSTVKMWALDKIQDRAGNYLQVSYIKDEANGVLYPDKIKYTGNDAAGIAPYNEIDFIYTDRPDARTKWQAGSKITLTKLLSEIKVYQNKTLVYDYKLTYESSPNTDRSRLTSIQLCDGNNHCFPATTFNWQTNAEGWEEDDNYAPPYYLLTSDFKDNGVRFEDINSDGLPDILLGNGYNRQASLNTGTGWKTDDDFAPPHGFVDQANQDNGIRFEDINGNGLVDLLQATNKNIHTWLNTGNKWQETTNYQLPKLIIDKSQDNGVRFLDLTGNGLPDIIQGASNNIHAWLNTHQQWQEISNYSPPHNFVDPSGQDSGIRLLDLNGDGLLDMLQGIPNLQHTSSNQHAWINNGQNWEETEEYKPNSNLVDVGGADNGVRFVDLNDDGLVDMIQADNSSIHTWINTGTGWQEVNTYNPPKNIASGHQDNGVRFVDINGDGIADMVLANNNNIHSWINISTGWKEIDAYKLPALIINRSQNNGIKFLDLNGDGLTDIVQGANGNAHAWLNKAKKLPDMLIGITNGLGEKTSIDYEPLSGTFVKVYSQEKKTDGILDTSYPNPQWDGPMYVVYQTASSTNTNDPLTLNKLAQTNGAGAYNPPQSPYSTIPNSNDLTNPQHITTYHYSGARINKLGWGFLGFHKIQITDNSTGITNTTIYSQDADNHLAHQPLETDTYNAKGTLLSSKQITWQVKYLTDNNQETIQDQAEFYLPYAATTITKSYDLNSGALLSTKEIDQTLEEVQQNNKIYCYGNVQNIKETVSNNTGTDITTTDTNNTYFNDPTNWIIGALTNTQVTISNSAGLSSTRTSSFAYDAKGMLQQTITEPGDPNLSVTKTFTRDKFGNILTTTTSWFDPVKQLTQSTTDSVTYDPEGRFVLTTTNALKQTISQTIDPRYGKPSSTTDLNGLTTTYQYDGFGRLIETDNPDSTITQTIYSWSNPSLQTIGSNNNVVTNYTQLQNDITQNPKVAMVGIGMQAQPIKTVYQVSTQLLDKNHQPISGQATKYYDELNREIATTTQNFDGKTIWKDTFYDDLGRVIQQSVPFFAGTASQDILYTRFKYDDLGRVVATINPDLSVINVTYEGYTTITTNPLQQKSIKITNTQGKIIEAIDNAGNKTYYQYDPYGNLISMQDSKGNISTITYDKLGRKIAINDPDKGHWTYNYNPLSELISQTDAKGQTTTFTYDDLGRMVQRTDHANTKDAITSTWQYDNAAHGIGKLASVNGVANLLGTNANALDLITAEKNGMVNYSRTITYDNLSRPSSTTVIINKQSYASTIEYDQNGRAWITTDPNGFMTINTYNQLGFITDINQTNPAKTKGKLLWHLNQMDAQGNITSFTRSNGMITNKTYDPATNFLVQIQTIPSAALILQQELLSQTNQSHSSDAANRSLGGAQRNPGNNINNSPNTAQHNPENNSTSIQDLQFTYDTLGNIQTRTNNVTNTNNSYQYDNLNRLTNWNQNGSNHSYSYDELGNITSKWDVGDYHYDCKDKAGNIFGPHAVSRITDGAGYVIATFSYDKNGAQTSGTFKGENRTINYTSFDKPLQINTQDAVTKQDKAQVNFYYNADRSRFERIDTDKQTNATITTLYLGNYELVVHNVNGTLTTEEKNYVGNTLVVHTINSDQTTTDQTYEILTDNLGSTSAITDATGNVIQRFSYTPFGEQQQLSLNQNTMTPRHNDTNKIITHHGFTGHEEIETVNLIHMTGRLYDPVLGRFLSADPTIQDPTNSQSLNRYSYCLNNPLAYTDPTGFSWFSDLLHDIGHAVQDVLNNQYVEIAIQIGINCIPGMQGWGAALACAVWQAELNLINGGSVEDALTGGGITFATSAAWIGTGDFLAIATKGASIEVAYGEKVAVHGLVGGGIAAAEGGNFQDGFLVNAVSEAIPIGSIGGKDALITPSIIAERGSAAAVVGGTVAAMTGGNFADGAKSAAFAELFNDCAHEMQRQYMQDKYEKLYVAWRVKALDQMKETNIRFPDYYALDINLAVPNPLTGTLVGVSGQVDLDRYGHFYWAPGGSLGKSTTLLSGNLSVGWLNQINTPSEYSLRSFLTGSSYNVGGGFILGGGETYSGGRTATEIGIYSPQFGVSYHYGWQYGTL